MNLVVSRLPSLAAAAVLACAASWVSFPSPALAAAAPAPAAKATELPAPKSADDLLHQVDDAMRRGGAWQTTVLVDVREKDKPAVVRQIDVYNQDSGKKVVLIFTDPKTQAGKGYLMIDRNIWYYDPTVGSWERRTVRDNIVGGMHRADFDAPHYAESYVPTLEGRENVNGVKAYKVLLKAKPDAEVASATVRIWVDPTNLNVVKDEQYSLSGKLLRTGLYKVWAKEFSAAKKADVWYPKQVQFESAEDGSITQFVVKQTSTKGYDESVFTKAWLERQSR